MNRDKRYTNEESKIEWERQNNVGRQLSVYSTAEVGYLVSQRCPEVLGVTCFSIDKSNNNNNNTIIIYYIFLDPISSSVARKRLMPCILEI